MSDNSMGDLLRRWRLLRGLSMAKLARELQVGVGTIERIEAGADPRVSLLAAYIRTLQIDRDGILAILVAAEILPADAVTRGRSGVLPFLGDEV